MLVHDLVTRAADGGPARAALTERGTTLDYGALADAVRTFSSALVDPQFFVWRAAASVAQTVYEGGVPSAEARRALAQNEAAIRDFAETALQAFREVESALATKRSLAEQEEFLRQGGFAGIRMADNTKCPSTSNFVLIILIHRFFFILLTFPWP